MSPLHNLGQVFIDTAAALGRSAVSAVGRLRRFLVSPTLESYDVGPPSYVLVFESDDARVSSPDTDANNLLAHPAMRGRKWKRRRAYCSGCGEERQFTRYLNPHDRDLTPHICVNAKPLRAAARGLSCP